MLFSELLDFESMTSSVIEIDRDLSQTNDNFEIEGYGKEVSSRLWKLESEKFLFA